MKQGDPSEPEPQAVTLHRLLRGTIGPRGYRAARALAEADVYLIAASDSWDAEKPREALVEVADVRCRELESLSTALAGVRHSRPGEMAGVAQSALGPLQQRDTTSFSRLSSRAVG